MSFVDRSLSAKQALSVSSHLVLFIVLIVTDSIKQNLNVLFVFTASVVVFRKSPIIFRLC